MQVLTTPEARRQGARPVLRDAARWPCFTLHDYTLQPLRQLTGAAALAELEAAVREHSAGPVQLTAAQVLLELRLDVGYQQWDTGGGTACPTLLRHRSCAATLGARS